MLHRDFLLHLFRASGEASLGTLKYFTLKNKLKFFRASGEAILGTQRYLHDATRRDNIRDYIRDYTSTLHKHFTQRYFTHPVRSLHKHLIKVFLKHFRNTPIKQLCTTSSYRGEVLRSLTCFCFFCCSSLAASKLNLRS